MLNQEMFRKIHNRLFVSYSPRGAQSAHPQNQFFMQE